jgi:hypothetical protein
LRILALCALLAVCGCANLMIDSFEKLRDTNKRNIAGLSLGMSRADVEQLMGREKVGGGLFDALYGRVQYQVAHNPMREERVRGSDGVDYEILFYYTDLRERDEKITDDELTPLAFRDGRLSGIGYAYVGPRVAKYAAFQR